MSDVLGEKVAKIVGPSVNAMGYDVVRAALNGGERRRTLQIMVERVDRAEMTVEDCAAVSRAVQRAAGLIRMVGVINMARVIHDAGEEFNNG